MKFRAFAVVCELGGEYRLDVFRLPGHQESHGSEESDLNTVRTLGCGPVVELIVELVEFIAGLHEASPHEEPEPCGGLSLVRHAQVISSEAGSFTCDGVRGQDGRPDTSEFADLVVNPGFSAHEQDEYEAQDCEPCLVGVKG